MCSRLQDFKKNHNFSKSFAYGCIVKLILFNLIGRLNCMSPTAGAIFVLAFDEINKLDGMIIRKIKFGKYS